MTTLIVDGDSADWFLGATRDLIDGEWVGVEAPPRRTSQRYDQLPKVIEEIAWEAYGEAGRGTITRPLQAGDKVILAGWGRTGGYTYDGDPFYSDGIPFATATVAEIMSGPPHITPPIVHVVTFTDVEAL